MGKSIGLLELKSIPVGIETADAVLKAANVELLTATPTCPGKYVIIICGAVGAVKSAMKRASIWSGTTPSTTCMPPSRRRSWARRRWDTSPPSA